MGRKTEAQLEEHRRKTEQLAEEVRKLQVQRIDGGKSSCSFFLSIQNEGTTNQDCRSRH